MDEEDLADAAEAQKLQTSDAFAGLGSSGRDGVDGGGLMGLFKADGDTKGLQLLRKMGWKTGQGIGPKVRRSARLEVGKASKAPSDATHLFAPDDSSMIQFVRKTDRKGLGHQGGTRLQGLERGAGSDQDDEDEKDAEEGASSLFSRNNEKKKPERGGIGVGVLNDDGSDDDDPYDIGPKIRYNRAIGDKKKSKLKRKAATATNPSLGSAPVFVPKTARAGKAFGRCHDGRLPLDGFVLSKVVQDMASLFLEYALPAVPEGWKSSKSRTGEANTSQSAYLSAADAAKSSTLDPRSRAALLGEKALPGKSVFDFISSSTRDRLASATGKHNLPPGLGELPEGLAPATDEEHREALAAQVPKLDQPTAAAALSRAASGPYGDDEAKRTRYRRYLSWQASPGTMSMPEKAAGETEDAFLKEMHEFYNCARIFKPMTGFMASRFTTSKSSSTTLNLSSSEDLVSKPEPKESDPAEEAAKLGMFGPVTRSTQDFYPTRLLCKRFNVRPPTHVAPDNGDETPRAKEPAASAAAAGAWAALPAPPAAEESETPQKEMPVAQELVQVNPETNAALEGKTANEDVLRAIFGDSDSE